jgi:hypothetical protein
VERLALQLPIVVRNKRAPVIQTGRGGVVRREHRGGLRIGGELRCGCRLLDPDTGVGQLEGVGHVLAGVALKVVADDEGLRKRCLLRLEIAVE